MIFLNHLKPNIYTYIYTYINTYIYIYIIYIYVYDTKTYLSTTGGEFKAQYNNHKITFT